MRDAFAANFDQGLEVGASVAVVHEGELVVDLWGGSADAAGTQPWERDTITNVWSTTKTMTVLCALMLADRGELDLHAPVARYWPEFAANGKEAVEVRHLFGHTSGLSGFEEPITAVDFCRLGDVHLPAGRPRRRGGSPGTASGYHAFTQGYLIGEIVRRVTGESLGTFFAKEVAGPLGADFHIGLPPEDDARVSNVIPPPPLPIGRRRPRRASRSARSRNPPPNAEYAWTESWRRAEIPAANGHGNARSVATIQAAVAGRGEVGGVRLLSSERAATPSSRSRRAAPTSSSASRCASAWATA